MSDSEFGTRFATGGEAELLELIDAYGEKLLRYATSVLCNRQDAEDAVQLAFIAAYDNRKTFDGRNLPAWLYKITHNQCLNHMKKRRPLLLGDACVKTTVNPFDDTGVNENFTSALARLSPTERALLYARVLDGYSYDDLVHIFGKSPAALRKMYERTKKKLAAALGEKRYYEGSAGNECKHEQT